MSFGRSGCAHCGGAGFTTRPDGELAQAFKCSCVPVCERCNDSGRLFVDEDGGRRLVRCRCQMLPDRIQIFNQAHIPARHHGSSFRSFDKDLPGAMQGFMAAWGWVEKWTPDSPGLVLFGDVGRGKTHLLIAALRELIFRHGVRVRFQEFTHLLSALKQGFESGTAETVVMQPLIEVDVLAIDEMGRGRNSEWELQVLDALISKRYNATRQLCGTTNFVPDASNRRQKNHNLATPERLTLGDRVGPRVYSRLKEMCRFAPVGGEDYRVRRR